MPKITMTAFCKSNSIAPALIRAVVRQSGGWSSFQESAQDISNHGASGGFSGWIYTNDCTSFTKRNRAAIVQELSSQAADLGEDLCSMVAGSNCLHSHKLSASDVGRVLFSGRGGDEDVRTLIENALAWSALEDVARAYVDWREQDQAEPHTHPTGALMDTRPNPFVAAFNVYMNEVERITQETLAREVWPLFRRRHYRLLSGQMLSPETFWISNRAGRRLSIWPHDHPNDPDFQYVLELLHKRIPKIENCVGDMGYDFPTNYDFPTK